MKRILFNVSEYDTISMCFSGKFPAAKSWPKLENMPIENGSFLTMRVKSERTNSYPIAISYHAVLD